MLSIVATVFNIAAQYPNFFNQVIVLSVEEGNKSKIFIKI